MWSCCPTCMVLFILKYGPIANVWLWQATHWCSCWSACEVLYLTCLVLFAQLCGPKGPFKCYVMLFFWKLDPHPPPRNANNIEHYTFVTLFSRKPDTPPHPHLRYITLECPLIGQLYGPVCPVSGPFPQLVEFPSNVNLHFHFTLMQKFKFWYNLKIIV